MAEQRQIGILVYDQVQGIDVVGPADAFSAAMVRDKSGRPVPAYKVSLIGLDPKPVKSESGVTFVPEFTVKNAQRLDTLILPGGRGVRLDPQAQNAVAEWVKQVAKSTARIASVCTGIFGLAATGLLDGRRVTTHWRFANDLAAQFPKLNVDANALYIKDGRFYSSAGVTAGIDLSLALIEEDHGPGLAIEVARELVVYLKREGGQEQYSEPLKFQAQAQDRLAVVAAWIVNHLNEDLSVERLAEKANVCPRHFSRLFRESVGSTPADFVEKLRLDEARRLLGERGSRIEVVADVVGFASADSFRRAFERRFGLTPSAYRGRFQTKQTSHRGRLRLVRRASA